MSPQLEREEIETFRRIVSERLGFVFGDDRLEQLVEVLQERISSTGCARFEDYRRRFASAASARMELRALAASLTVGETYFFRHPDHFRVFKEVVLPGFLGISASPRPLNVLSAGCASGEEPYTLGALVHQHFNPGSTWPVSITGIDVNEVMLEKAKAGRYSEWSFRATSEDIRRRIFRPVGREFELAPEIRSMVTFVERNLMDEDGEFWKPGAFDVIFCRNVTMYFSPEVTRTVIARFERSLVPGGFLFLGPAETLRGVSQGFHLRHSHDTFYYQRRLAGESVAPASRDAEAPWIFQAPAAEVLLAADDSWVDAIARATDRISALTDAGRPGVISPGAALRPAKAAGHDLSVIWGLLRHERFEEALLALEALPPVFDDSIDIELLRAALLTNRGKVEQAEIVCQRILAVDEMNAGAHYLKALSREHAGDRNAAIEQDQAAMYLDPSFAMPHLHLALLAKSLGDFETARRELGHALILLEREDASRILLFGGGFKRETLMQLCRTELRTCGGGR